MDQSSLISEMLQRFDEIRQKELSKYLARIKEIDKELTNKLVVISQTQDAESLASLEKELSSL